MKIEGPTFDEMLNMLAGGMRTHAPTMARILVGVADTLEALPGFLRARTAESNINAVHTTRYKEYMTGQMRKSQVQISELKSKLIKAEAKMRSLESHQSPPPAQEGQQPAPKKDPNPRQALREFNKKEAAKEPPNRMRGLEKLAVLRENLSDEEQSEIADFDDADKQEQSSPT